MTTRAPRLGLALLLACGLALAGGTSHATVLVPADFGQLAREAAAVVRGRVVEAQPTWVEGRRRVETIVVLQVLETYKGSWGSRVTLQLPGGRLGRYRSVLLGAPRLDVGDEVVLFLGARPPALPFVLGLSQGLFRVQRDAASGDARVITPVIANADAATAPVQRGDPARRSLTLPEFATQLKAALDADPARSRDRAGRADR